MGSRHDRATLLAAAVEVALEDGLHRLSFGRVARRLGIADRMVVYYFATKETLVAEVVEALAQGMRPMLAKAFAGAAARDHAALVRAAWPTLTDPAYEPSFRLFFEALGLGIRRVAPYERVVAAAIDGWIAFLEAHLDVPAADRRAEAEAALALVDGLLLLRFVAGAEAADRAADRLWA